MVDETPVEYRPRNGRIQQAMTDKSDLGLRDWIETLGNNDDFRIKIDRKTPSKYMTKNGPIEIKGHLETIEDDLIDEETIKELYGGGSYRVVLERRNPRGNFEYFKARTVTIPGKPNLKQYGIDEDDSTAGNASLQAQAMETMKQLIRNGGSNGGNPQQMAAMMQTMMQPVMVQLEASQKAQNELQARIAQKDSQLLQILAERGKVDPAQNQLLDKMWSSESGRLESLRAQHESELRMMRENHREDLKRLEQNNKDTINRLSDAHAREIDSLNRSYAGQIEAYKTSFETRIDGLKSEISRLERELNEKNSEVGELRAKKDKSIADQTMELASIHESLKNVFGGNDEDPPKWYERIATTVLDNPDAIKSLVGAGAPPPQPQAALPQPQAAQLPPPGQPFQIPGDSRVFIRDEVGNTREMTQQELQALQAEHEAAQAAQNGGVRPPNPGEVRVAIMFMENAIKNGTEPETFAESARSAIPADILRYIEAKGPDAFLDEMANQLEPSSPLRGQTGRNFVRKVSKYLLTGSTE